MKPIKLPTLLFMLALILSACNLPNGAPASTIEAPATASSTPLPAVTVIVQTATSNLAGTPANTATPPPTSTSAPGTSACTNRADFVTDISIPDGSQLASNVSFVKTWRIRNSGTCSWDSRYSLVFVDGTLLMPVDDAPLLGTVAPGQTLDLSLNMTAPIYPGNYESDWMLRSPSGALFGVGQKDAPLWVKIAISSPNTTNIMGYVYQDRNGNAVYDQNDVLMANREVWLQEGSCGQARTRLTSTVSGSDGRYTLSGVFAGTMCVTLMGTEGGADDASTVSTATGQTMSNVDLRAAVPNALVSGWVWNNSLPSTGIAGAVVVMQRGQCGSPLSVTISTTTDANGHYYFSDLYSGPYCVSIRTYEGNNVSIFGSGTWAYPVNGIQELTLTPGQEGIANFGWQYK